MAVNTSQMQYAIAVLVGRLRSKQHRYLPQENAAMASTDNAG